MSTTVEEKIDIECKNKTKRNETNEKEPALITLYCLDCVLQEWKKYARKEDG